MHLTHSFSFLRRVLAFDAISCAAMGLGLIMLAPALSNVLGLPVELLRQSGWVLLPFASFVAVLATRAHPWRPGVWAVIALNALWTVDSVALLISGWVEPSGLGYAFVIGQAVVVGVLAELEVIGLRKASPLITA